ncbi:MAG: hypothetical protein EXQ96_00660 [Alphaproteobacteria bacterium]|nr:hypothetical protein [Alphaproteobacteria bacterium]
MNWLRKLVAAVAACVLLGIVPSFADQKDPRLDEYFARLYKSANEAEIATLEQLIWRTWAETGDATIDRLFREGVEAIQTFDFSKALYIFTGITGRLPDFAEGWNKRATLYFMMEEYGKSLADVDVTLKLEPRHFGALAGLGHIRLRLGDLEDSVKAYEYALKVNPHMPVVRLQLEQVKQVLSRRRA